MMIDAPKSSMFLIESQYFDVMIHRVELILDGYVCGCAFYLFSFSCVASLKNSRFIKNTALQLNAILLTTIYSHKPPLIRSKNKTN